MVQESLEDVVLAKESSQPQSSYEAAATLTEFKLKKILIDKIDKNQEENLGKEDEEPKEKFASKRDWFTKSTQPQEPINPDWNVDKTPQQGQNQSWLMTLASLLKGTHSNYAEFEYDFEECYKALLEKLDWENPEGGDYPFDLTKPLPLVMSRNHQKVHVDYFFNNDLKYLQGGISTMTYTTSITKIKAAQYDLPGIKDMVPK
ncbi:hypothetical protein Tco_0642714 [Tanacetum coccineum]